MNPHCVSCPYCENVPGVGISHAPLTNVSGFDLVLDEAENAVVIPTVGMFIPGYLLLVTRKHVTSFAQISADELKKIESFLAVRLRVYAKMFGEEYLVFEHGMPMTPLNVPYGGCIDHAHFHLIPAASQCRDTLMSHFAWERITSLSDLCAFARQGYLFLATSEGYWIAQPSAVPSQWIRRVVSTCLRLECPWDWAIYPGEAELKLTLTKFQKDSG